jgi:hypothetical protein
MIKKQHLVSELFILLRGVSKVLDKLAYGKGLNGLARLAYNLLIKDRKIQQVFVKLDTIIDKPFELVDRIDEVLPVIDMIQFVLHSIDLEKKGILKRIILKILNGKGKLAKFKNKLEMDLEKLETILKDIQHLNNESDDKQADSI